MKETFIKIYLVGFTLAGILHLIGFLILYKVKDNLTNQRIITMNLAVTEMVSSWYQVILFAVLINGDMTPKWLLPDTFLTVIFHSIIRMIVILIIADRFLDIYLNLKYPIYMDKTRLIVITVILWILSAMFASSMVLTIHFGVGPILVEKILGYTFLALDIVITLFAILTYTYLYLCVKKMSEWDNSSGVNRNGSRKKAIYHKFKVPCLMVASYLIFNVSGTILKTSVAFMSVGEQTWLLVFGISNILVICGWISDAFIYVLYPFLLDLGFCMWCTATV